MRLMVNPSPTQSAIPIIKTMKVRTTLLVALATLSLLPSGYSAVAKPTPKPRIIRRINPKPIVLPYFLKNSPVFKAFLSKYNLTEKVTYVSPHY